MNNDYIQIEVRCTAEPHTHAKFLRLDPVFGVEWAGTLSQLLDGTSPLYVHPPGPLSPIGKCAICQAPLQATVQEVYNVLRPPQGTKRKESDAKPKKQRRRA
jgi:hypothetical protein